MFESFTAVVRQNAVNSIHICGLQQHSKYWQQLDLTVIKIHLMMITVKTLIPTQ